MPTNRKMQRINHPDVIYRSEREKYEAIADEIERMNKWDVVVPEKGDELLGKILRETDDAIEFQDRETRQKQTIPRSQIRSIERAGRPILVGTVSIERSEMISRMLEQRGVPHQVLNAKHHQREAEIIAQAGRKGAVTIATNMAGRGTDIILGGNPEAMAWAQLQTKYPTRLDVPPEEWDALVHEIEQREQMKPEGREVAAMGGLHVLGSERHEARRIDLQLRGRCGRQGDAGSSRFYLSLEDDLMRKFGGEWVKNWLTRLGMQDGEAIESRMVSRRIEGAQKKVEERNFEVRKNLLEYDEVMDEQRKRVYGYRQRILEGGNCKQLVLDMIRQQIDARLEPVPCPRLRHGDLRQVGGQGVVGGVRRPRLPRPRFPGCPAVCHGPGRAEGRGPDHGRPGREPSHRRRRQERLELGGPGQVRQHALAHGHPRPRVEAGRPRAARYVSPGEGHGGDRQGRSRRPAASSWRPITASARPVPG